MNSTGETSLIKKCKNCKLLVSGGNSLNCGSCGGSVHLGCTEHSYDKTTLDRMNKAHSEIYYMCAATADTTFEIWGRK